MPLAALAHDMERAFPGPDQPVQNVVTGFGDHDDNVAHSARSARIVSAWLREQAADISLAREVERLIHVFLETNVDLFLSMVRSGKRTMQEVLNKFGFTYERIRVAQARELALPLYEQAKARLIALEAKST